MMRSEPNHIKKNGKSSQSILMDNLYSDINPSRDYEPGLISIIAPCYNEEENIKPFLKEVYSVDLGQYRKEVIVVNDGSSDRSRSILNKMKDRYSNLKIIHFSRNFGQQQALMAGIQKARGELLVTLDIDLQQPPDLIPSMIQLYEQGYHVVHAIPEYHQSATIFKRITSKAYYNFIHFLGPEEVVYKSNDFRMFSHPIAEVVRSLPERSLYLRGIFAWLCPLDDNLQINKPIEQNVWKSTILPYRHQSRQYGQTKYSIPKMVALAFDGMTAISIQPLRLGLFLGMGSIGLATGLALWALYMHLVAGQTVSGWTSLMIVILFFSSIQFLLMGLIGEYIGKIFLQVRERPGHIIDDINYQHKRIEWPLSKHHKSANSKSIS